MVKTEVLAATLAVIDSFLATCGPRRLPPMFLLYIKLVYLPA
jgi:hypothetical protein